MNGVLIDLPKKIIQAISCKAKAIFKSNQPVNLGRGELEETDYLAFADEVAILTCDISTTQKQFELHKESEENVVINFFLDIFQTNQDTLFLAKKTPKYVETKYASIKRVPIFEYLGKTRFIKLDSNNCQRN